MEQETKDINEVPYFRVFFIFLSIIISPFAIFYFLIANKLEKSIQEIKFEDTAVFEETTVTDTEDVLKEYNGKIGIFENEALIYTLDTYIFTLPENDKKLLAEGIVVSTQKELYELLEQYY